ncbi:MAG: hypothetical protein ACR2QM_05675 [Longimicrobiales bacterium]
MTIRSRALASWTPILAASLVTGCGIFGGSEAAAPGGGPSPEPALAQRQDVLGPVSQESRVYSDNSGSFPDSARVVVLDEGAWVAMWDQATALQSDPAPMPFVNFTNTMVIAVAAGRMTPEDQIRVDSVGVRSVRSEAGELIDVFEVVVRTTEGCGRLRVEAFPMEIVKTARFEGEVRFVERREQSQSCGDTG